MKTEIDLNVIKRFCDDKKDWAQNVLVGNCEEYELLMRKPVPTSVDAKDTVRVLKKFYKFAYTNKNCDRSVILVTNKGNVIEDNGINEDSGGVWINADDQCLGDNMNSWSAALVDIKTTSDFLAQLAVFANKHAK